MYKSAAMKLLCIYISIISTLFSEYCDCIVESIDRLSDSCRRRTPFVMKKI